MSLPLRLHYYIPLQESLSLIRLPYLLLWMLFLHNTMPFTRSRRTRTTREVIFHYISLQSRKLITILFLDKTGQQPPPVSSSTSRPTSRRTSSRPSSLESQNNHHRTLSFNTTPGVNPFNDLNDKEKGGSSNINNNMYPKDDLGDHTSSVLIPNKSLSSDTVSNTLSGDGKAGVANSEVSM